MRCVAVCCSACCSVIILQVIEGSDIDAAHHAEIRCITVCCSVLQCVAVCCSVLQCVAVCCSVLQCEIVCGYDFRGNGGLVPCCYDVKDVY